MQWRPRGHGAGLLSLLWSAICLGSVAASAETGAPHPKRLNVILVGATSSLAKKYLWQSFFRAFLAEETRPEGPAVDMHVYGGATRAPEEGVPLLQSILESTTRCDGIVGVDPSVCEAKLQEYRGRVQYQQLKVQDHYSELSARLKTEMTREDGRVESEAGRLFYLAIDPSYYVPTAAAISRMARPNSDTAYLRVVFEKPFGRDLTTAKELAEGLSQHLSEEEVYRVDHYMGKAVVQGILPFRHANSHWLEQMWNGDHVESVEVAIKETEACEGRTTFYEGYGVIRDVLQNHLTEILVLLKMDLPPHDEHGVFGSHEHRTAVLKSLRLKGCDPDACATIRVGQYAGYQDHVSADKKQPREEVLSRVPTAAAVTLSAEDPRWHGVKFKLKAGKALDERSAYARVTLKSHREDLTNNSCQLAFNIQGPSIGSSISWDRSACEGLLPGNWQVPSGWAAEQADSLVRLAPIDKSPPNAYDVVVQEVLEGDRSMFLGTEELLHQWIVWDQVLERADQFEPEIYPPGFNLDEFEAQAMLVPDRTADTELVREEL